MCGYLTHQSHHLSSVCRASFVSSTLLTSGNDLPPSVPIPMAISESKKKRLEAKAAKAAAKGETVSRVSSKASLKKVGSVADSLASQMEDGTFALSSLSSSSSSSFFFFTLYPPLPTLTRPPCTYV